MIYARYPGYIEFWPPNAGPSSSAGYSQQRSSNNQDARRYFDMSSKITLKLLRTRPLRQTVSETNQ